MQTFPYDLHERLLTLGVTVECDVSTIVGTTQSSYTVPKNQRTLGLDELGKATVSTVLG